MSKKLYSLEVNGRNSRWSFEVWLDPKFLDEYRQDGLDVHEIVNTIPVWVHDLKLTRLWCWLQDKAVIKIG